MRLMHFSSPLLSPEDLKKEMMTIPAYEKSSAEEEAACIRNNWKLATRHLDDVTALLMARTCSATGAAYSCNGWQNEIHFPRTVRLSHLAKILKKDWPNHVQFFLEGLPIKVLEHDPVRIVIGAERATPCSWSPCVPFGEGSLMTTECDRERWCFVHVDNNVQVIMRDQAGLSLTDMTY